MASASPLPPPQPLSISVFALMSHKHLFMAKRIIWERDVRQGVLSSSIPSLPLPLERYRIFCSEFWHGTWLSSYKLYFPLWLVTAIWLKCTPTDVSRRDAGTFRVLLVSCSQLGLAGKACCAHLPHSGLVTFPCQPGISHRGCIYTTEAGRHHKPWLPLSCC